MLRGVKNFLQNYYGLSERGEEELGRSSTTLPARALELLVRLDAALTLAQVRAHMQDVSDQEFEQAFDLLRHTRLIEPVVVDTFTLGMEAELSALRGQAGGSDADAGVRSLQRSGYYVRIARPAPPVPRPPGHQLTAVVVEDDANLARFVSTYLGFENIHARIARNREEVLAQFKQLPVPDIVLLDVMLPDADGFQILASLRRHPAFRRVPVIMLTGKATREAVLAGLAGGADGYVTKPFEPDALMSAVRTVLRLSPPA